MSDVYHSGEKEVQARAGVRVMAERIGRSIQPGIPPAAKEFLQRQSFVVIGSVDAEGGVWASVLTGEAGFASASGDHTVRIQAEPQPEDPLGKNWIDHNRIGLLAIEFASRQRMRINGTIKRGEDGSMYLTSHQVYSNCPKYIQARSQQHEPSEMTAARRTIKKSKNLSGDQQQWIRQADTFFLASSHPEAGNDVSHRGGNPGFIQGRDASTLLWPDYSGNMMFQTLGNIVSYPKAGLLFIDFDRGNTLQLTGKAAIHWSNENPDAERHIEFSIEQTIEIAGAFPSGWKFVDFSRHNPAVSP